MYDDGLRVVECRERCGDAPCLSGQALEKDRQMQDGFEIDEAVGVGGWRQGLAKPFRSGIFVLGTWYSVPRSTSDCCLMVTKTTQCNISTNHAKARVS